MAARNPLIKTNLHFSGHMTWSVNTRTIEAVHPHVTEQALAKIEEDTRR